MAAKSEKWKGAKTRNLTAKQQEKAKRIVGGGRTEKVTKAERKAAGTEVKIGDTKWMTAKERKAAGQKGRGGLLTDASGKAITGTVTLASGKKAQYVRGKRIGVVAKKPTTGSGPSRTRTNVSRTSTPRVSADQAERRAMGGTTGAGSVRPATASPRQMSAQYRQQAAARRRMTRPGTAMTSAAGTRVSMSSATPPKRGDKRTIMRNGNRIGQRYDGTKWVDSA